MSVITRPHGGLPRLYHHKVKGIFGIEHGAGFIEHYGGPLVVGSTFAIGNRLHTVVEVRDQHYYVEVVTKSSRIRKESR